MPNAHPINRRFTGTRLVWDGCVSDRTQPYDTDNTAASTRTIATLYPKTSCQEEPDLQEYNDRRNQAPVQPLDDNLGAVRTNAGKMVAKGATNIAIGVQWGMEALTDDAPLQGARADAQKVMILLTDGENTINRWQGDGRDLPDFVTSRLNERTKLACQKAKEMGIEMFAINLIEADSALLSGCASGPDHFKAVKNASELDATFSGIVEQIGPLRLVM